MKAKELKILMIQKDITQQRIASEAGVTRQTVCLVCNGYSRSKRVEKLVARSVSLPRQLIFPIVPEPLRSREAA